MTRGRLRAATQLHASKVLNVCGTFGYTGPVTTSSAALGAAPNGTTRGVRRRFHRTFAAALVLAMTASVTPANAEEPPGAWSWLWVNGSSPGEPSTGKLVTLYSLYGLALGGLAVGGVGYYSAMKAQDTTAEFRAQHTTPSPCFDLTSRTCEELERLRADERANQKLGALGVASAGLFLLSGVVIAHQWDNVQPSVTAWEDGATLQVRLSF